MLENLSELDITPEQGDEEACAAAYCRTCRRFIYIGFTGRKLIDPVEDYLRAEVAISRAQIHTSIYPREPHHVQVVQGTKMIFEENEPQPEKPSEYIWVSYQAQNYLH